MLTNPSTLVETFDQYHLVTTVIVFAIIGFLSVLGMAVLFFFRVTEEVVTAYYRFRANIRTARKEFGEEKT